MVGHERHQRQGNLHRVRRKPDVFLGLDIQRRGGGLAFTQVLNPRKQTLLQRSQRAQHRAFARLGALHPDRNFVAPHFELYLNPRAAELERAVVTAERQLGQHALPQHERRQETDQLPGQLDTSA